MINDLKVFQKTYDFILYIYPVLQKYPKSERFSLRLRIENSMITVLEEIISAHYLKNKQEHLRKANLELEKLRVFIRLSYDLKYINIRKYGICSRQVNEIGKMIGGWLKN